MVGYLLDRPHHFKTATVINLLDLADRKKEGQPS